MDNEELENRPKEQFNESNENNDAPREGRHPRQRIHVSHAYSSNSRPSGDDGGFRPDGFGSNLTSGNDDDNMHQHSYRPRYKNNDSEGGYQPRQGGYRPRYNNNDSEGGYQPRQGRYNNRQGGGYRPRYKNNDSEGGYQARQGGYNNRQGVDIVPVTTTMILKADTSLVREDTTTVKGDINLVRGDTTIVKGDINLVREDTTTVKGDTITAKVDTSLDSTRTTMIQMQNTASRSV